MAAVRGKHSGGVHFRDAQELIGRLKAIKAMSEEYTSFAGAKSDMPGSVRFVIRTDSIEK